jgi:hypothetical protein
MKYGDLNRTGTPEAIAGVRLRRFADKANGIPLISLAVLRRIGNSWIPVLRGDRQVRNEAGYIGIDYVDDRFAFYGYRILLTDRRSDGSVGFTIALTYMDRMGSPERCSDGSFLECKGSTLPGIRDQQ